MDSSDTINASCGTSVPGGQCNEARRSRPLCKAVGCSTDLVALGRPYCLKKRLCPVHLRASALKLAGTAVPLRFCQQCGKLEPLSRFAGDKRSCRASLERRRRAPGLEMRADASTQRQQAVAVAGNGQPRTCSTAASHMPAVPTWPLLVSPESGVANSECASATLVDTWSMARIGGEEQSMLLDATADLQLQDLLGINANNVTLLPYAATPAGGAVCRDGFAHSRWAELEQDIDKCIEQELHAAGFAVFETTAAPSLKNVQTRVQTPVHLLAAEVDASAPAARLAVLAAQVAQLQQVVQSTCLALRCAAGMPVCAEQCQ